MNSRRAQWPRSPWSPVLVVAALLTSLVLGTAFLVINNRAADAVDVRDGLTDAQASAEVVQSARQIVNVAQLREVTGGYAFVSCRNESEPPYQVALYMNFRLPQGDSIKYLHDVAAAVTANGWSNAPALAEHFGYKPDKERRYVDLLPQPQRCELRQHAPLRRVPRRRRPPPRRPGVDRGHAAGLTMISRRGFAAAGRCPASVRA